MALVVQKIGGTSLADSASRDAVAARAAEAVRKGDRVVLVVSAMGREGDPYATDTLLGLLGEYRAGAGGLVRDLAASCGEVISACVIAAMLSSKGMPALPMTAYTAGIRAEGSFGDAAPVSVDAARLHAVIDAGTIPVVTGFQGTDLNGDIHTLGRGGSDTSAVAIGVALGADRVEILKDVPGVAKADPRVVRDPPYLDILDHGSMFRLANQGARVLHDKSALLARDAGMTILVRSVNGDGAGTRIVPEGSGVSVPDFIGLASAPGPEGTMRVAAVFAGGVGAKGAGVADGFCSTSGIPATPRDSGDPDVRAYLCPKDRGREFASGLFRALAAAFP